MAFLGASSSIWQLVSRSDLSEVPSSPYGASFSGCTRAWGSSGLCEEHHGEEAAAPRVTLQNLSQKQK